MDEPSYQFDAQPIEFFYRFDSVSTNKTVQKVVAITETPLLNVFNLSLLDVLDTGELSDETVSNNQDMPTVLSTVLKIAENFLARFPDKVLTFRGSDDRRTRLYRIVIARELTKLQARFTIIGQIGSAVELFQLDQPYTQFYIKLK